MTIRNLCVVFLRLMALNTMLMGVIQLGPTIARTFSSNREFSFFSLGLALVLFAAALGLWSAAPWLAGKTTRGYDSPVQIEGLTLRNLYSLVIFGISLTYAIGHMAPALNWLHYFFTIQASPMSVEMQRENFYETFASVVPFILGIMGILFCDRLAQRILQHQDKTTP